MNNSEFKMAKTQWVWSRVAESKYPERKAGEPIWPWLRKSVYRSWVEKGYVIDESNFWFGEGYDMKPYQNLKEPYKTWYNEGYEARIMSKEC